MGKEFDIHNSSEREVICNDVYGAMHCSNPIDKLVKGQTYHVRNVAVYPWHTEVFLKEFPDETKGFNSVLFDEIPKKKKQLQEHSIALVEEEENCLRAKSFGHMDDILTQGAFTGATIEKTTVANIKNYLGNRQEELILGIRLPNGTLVSIAIVEDM